MEGKNRAPFKIAQKEKDMKEADEETFRGDMDDIMYKKYPITGVILL